MGSEIRDVLYMYMKNAGPVLGIGYGALLLLYYLKLCWHFVAGSQ